MTHHICHNPEEYRPTVCIVNVTDLLILRAIANYASTYPKVRIATAIPISYDRYSRRHPAPKQLRQSLRHENPLIGPRRIRKIIYFDSSDPNNLFEHIKNMLCLTQIEPDAILFNLPWPPIRQLEKIRVVYPSIDLILKIDPCAYDIAHRSPRNVMKRLNSYRLLIDEVLLKPKNREMTEPIDLTSAAELIEYLSDCAGWLSLAVAGGFNEMSLDPLREFLKSKAGVGIFAYKQLVGRPEMGPDIEVCCSFLDMIRTAYPKRALY